MSAARLRIGAALLALSSLSFALFPSVRPYFALDPRTPAATLEAAAPLVTSMEWTLAHAIVTIAFVPLICALPLLSPALARTALEPRAPGALLASLAGTALVLPTLGVELYAVPAVGRVYREGAPDIAPIVTYLYIGPMTAVMILGLVLLAAGAIRSRAAAMGDGAVGGRPDALAAATAAVGTRRRRPGDRYRRHVAGVDAVARTRRGDLAGA